MQDVPKIVVQRLRSPATDSHPDADLLTAFAEQSLTGRERESIVDHLARCGDCREVVAVALPASEAVALGNSIRPARRGWLTWPAVRWGFVAAGILAITSVGVLQYRQGHQKQAMSLMARNQVAETVMQNSSPSAPQPNPTSSDVRDKTETLKAGILKKDASRILNEPIAGKSSSSAKENFSPSQVVHGFVTGSQIAGGSAGRTIGGPIQRDAGSSHDFARFTSQTSAPAATAEQSPVPGVAPQQPVPRSSTMVEVEVSGAAPAVQTETARSQNQDQLVQNKQADLPLNGRNEIVVRAKPTGEQAAALAPAPMLHADPGLMKSQFQPRWTISASGALQRSLDGGKTWLDVNLAMDNSLNSNLKSRAQNEVVTVEAQLGSPAAKSETKTDAKSTATPTAATIFRALAVLPNSSEVWAGGSGGALYHTIDGGNLWVRVVPSANGIVLTGGVVSIQFTDSRDGTVTTSTAEIWTTNDAAQTWRKQQ